MITAVAVIIDASVVTAVALLVCRALRRRPAALRHLVLAAALAAVAAIPILETTIPHWDVPMLTGASAVTTSGLTLNSDLVVASAVDASQTLDGPAHAWSLMLLVVWSLGFIAVMAGLVVGLVRLMVTTWRCQPVQSNTWRERAALLSREHGLTRSVVVLECPDRSLLLTWGLFRPRIIVPAGARSWTTGRIDVVLAHELAHIVRRDWVVQIAAEIVRAVHWFNPLVWMTSRRLRDESEQSCDDAVLRRGLTAVDYASHLLAVARHVAANGRRWASAPAVADPSTLERRISAMLNVSRNHATLTRANRAVTVLAMFALTLPLAAVTLTERLDSRSIVTSDLRDIALAPTAAVPPPAVAVPRPRRVRPAATAAAAAQQPASVSGTVRDSSGALLPGVQLTLTSTVSDIRASTVTDSAGAFVFRNVPPSSYALVAQLPGFSTLKTELMLASGEDVQRSMTLRIGSVMETVRVNCAPGVAAVDALDARVAAAVRRTATPRLFVSSRQLPVIEVAFAAQQAPLRIGGQIAAPRRIKDVSPTCPRPLPAEGAVVILESTVGVDGTVTDVKAVRPDSGVFVQAAIDAIRQWQFTPTRLNGEPVPVIMTVTVTFTTR